MPSEFITERKQISAPKSADASMEKLVRKMYISNVAKRLRALNQPTDNDRKRWIWELIQNAKDTIAGDPLRDKVNIRIEIEGDIVRFRHNGNPFTMDARFGLLWKYSEDKENQESTGRFGTGFLTTHCLSKTVTIESNVYDEDTIRGFAVTMFREGQTEQELLDGLDKMKDSERWYDMPYDWTTFTYNVNSESGRRAIALGVESFNENIVRTMLFCSELGSVILDNNGIITTIKRESTREVGNGIELKTFQFITDRESSVKSFLEKSFSEDSPELTKKYRTDRKIRIDVALELSDTETLGGESNKLSHFCALPLVGVESQLDSPIIINSPDFEPDDERQSLLLNGITRDEESDTITEIGINRLIYSKTISLYEDLVQYVSKNSFKNLYLLIRGLKRAKEHEKLDKKWFEDDVLSTYREVISRYNVVAPLSGGPLQKITNSVFIKETSLEKENALLSLVSATNYGQLAIENHKWSSLLWKEGINLWGLEDFCSVIEQTANWSRMSIERTILNDWYNKFLTHVKTTDENLLKNHALLPDCNGVFKKKDAEGFKQGENISDFIITLLAGFGQDMKGSLLNQSITAVSLESKYNSQRYSADINRHVKEITDTATIADCITKLLPLISVIPTDLERYGAEFIQKRKEYSQIIIKLFDLSDVAMKEDNSLLKTAWDNLDVWIKTTCLNKIQTMGKLDDMPAGLDVAWLSSCINSFASTSEDLNKYKVLPNQYGVFCFCKDLFCDDGIPDCLKDDKFKLIDLDYKSLLLDKGFDSSISKITSKKSIGDFSNSIKDKFSSSSSYGSNNSYYWNSYLFDGRYHKYSESILSNVALFLCSILPAQTSDEDNDWQRKQKLIQEVAIAIIPAQALPSTSYINYGKDDLWKDANEYVRKAISKEIESLGSLSKLSEHLKNCGEIKAIEHLNKFYECGGAGTIFPDQNGIFRKLSDLKKEGEIIDEMLKDIIELIVPEGESYRSLLEDTRCTKQPEEKISCADAYKLIDDKIDNLFKINDNWSDIRFKNAVHLLIEEWAEKNGSIWDADHFPKIFDKRDRLLMNIVWTKEERQSIQRMKTTLTPESINYILENAALIMSMPTRMAKLEEENRRLMAIIEENGNEGSSLGADEGNKLSTEEIARLNAEAKEIVKLEMEKEGFVFEKGLGDHSTVNGVYKDGIEFPLVIKSCLGRRRRIYMNPLEWEQLSRPNSMLWLYFGNRVIAPVKAYDLITYHDRLSLSFGSINLKDTAKVSALMAAFRCLKDVHLDLVSVNPYKETGKTLESYLFNSNNILNSNTEAEDDCILPGA